MAKGQKRSNRELKKPKKTAAAKLPDSAARTPFPALRPAGGKAR